MPMAPGENRTAGNTLARIFCTYTPTYTRCLVVTPLAPVKSIVDTELTVIQALPRREGKSGTGGGLDRAK